MQYYNNILCCEQNWLIEQRIISASNIKVLKSRGIIQAARRGCRNTTALIAYESIPKRFQDVIVNKIGDPYQLVKKEKFEDRIKLDPEAPSFFSKYKLEDGRNLPPEVQLQYTNDAHIFYTITGLISKRKNIKKALGNKAKKLWENVTESINSIDKNKWDHTLPTSRVRIQKRYYRYQELGYLGLISNKWGNDNSRKVNVLIEKLILSLYILPNKPYNKSVHDLYLQFLGGAIDVVDKDTGELFDREDFKENGVLVELSEGTIYNYINSPKNRPIVDSYRSGKLEFSSTHRPHAHRTQAKMSLSKISMDDRDLRKMKDGIRLKAYYAYDVASGCVIGSAYNSFKKTPLFIDCMRDMFNFLNSKGLGIPMEVEVEHHLVKEFKDGLMKAKNVFPFVRWANPGNSQEKYAETLHRIKKYGYEKKYQDGIGRFYSKLEANRPVQEKIFDAENNNYQEKTYSKEELIAADLEVIEKYNNDQHPNQKLYKGMTRLEVLIYHANPNVAKYEEYLLAKYIGESTPTTIRRNQYVSANYAKYVLPSLEVLDRLAPNNLNVTAYWLPSHKQEAVHLYQNGEYICTCDKIVEFQTATAEMTKEDKEAFLRQSKYISKFDSHIKESRKQLAKVEIIENKGFDDEIEVEIVNTKSIEDDDWDLESLKNKSTYQKKSAIDNL